MISHAVLHSLLEEFDQHGCGCRGIPLQLHDLISQTEGRLLGLIVSHHFNDGLQVFFVEEHHLVGGAVLFGRLGDRGYRQPFKYQCMAELHIASALREHGHD